MSKTECPTPETLAEFVAGAASEQAWRAMLRHLSECTLCRRHAGLLAVSQDEGLLPAGPPPDFNRAASPARRGAWGFGLRALAAVVVLGAIGWALWYMKQPRGTTPEMPVTNAAPTPAKNEAPPAPAPESPPVREFAPTPKLDPEPRPRTPFVPSTVVRKPEPGKRPAPAPEPEAPEPVEKKLAQRVGGGIVEAVEVMPGTGKVAVVRRGKAGELIGETYVNPSDRLRATGPASVVLPDGQTVHLKADSDVSVAWSQTLLCYAFTVRRGEALVDVGAEPKQIVIAGAAPGIQLSETSGQLFLAASPDGLRATPINGSAGFRGMGGIDRRLNPRQTLVLGWNEDRMEDGGPDNATLAAFVAPPPEAPEPEAPPKEVVKNPEPPKKAEPALPHAGKLMLDLAGTKYRFRISGRFVREGVWHPTGIYSSSVEEFTAVTRIGRGQASHLRRGNLPWDKLGTVRKGSREERIVGMLQAALPPHVQVEKSFAAVEGTPAVRSTMIQGRSCTVAEFKLSPGLIRPDMEALLRRAVIDKRMARPDFHYWDSVEGTLELAITKDDPRVIRAVDRRRVPYAYRTASGLTRRWYTLATVYEFHDHGEARLRLPLELLRELDPRRK